MTPTPRQASEAVDHPLLFPALPQLRHPLPLDPRRRLHLATSADSPLLTFPPCRLLDQCPQEMKLVRRAPSTKETTTRILLLLYPIKML